MIKKLTYLLMLSPIVAFAQAKGSIECDILRNQVIQAYANTGNSQQESTQQQLAQQQALAVQMAQLTPAQRASANMQIAGNQIATGLAQTFGSQSTQSKETLLNQYKSRCE